ncbi:uncharacterized protein LOC100214441 isoform X1 [Hydra vulgaris]|uniref:uncharacterized protein LOC100214441 isoform X1 n=1 Tax=Hydra vulgaris TaxID=6087 RepID=UPI001F5E868D|nr:uncharacterized protein LOC100214441 [Hydra vulgaris]
MKPKSIYLIFKCTLLFFVISATTEEYPCESEEWKYYQGYCYWSSLYHQSPFHHQSNWFNAARECRKRKSDLASIQNLGENHLVFTLNRCANAWIGLVMIDNNLITSESDYIDRREEFVLTQGNLIGTLNTMRKEYSISFNIKPTRIIWNFWGSVLLLTTGSSVDVYGGRNPGVWFHEDGSGRLRIHASVSGNPHYYFDTKILLNLNQWSKVRIYQSFIGGKYWFSVDINGVNIHRVENSDARDFENMKIYASQPFHSAQHGFMSDLLIFNAKADWEWFDNSKRNYVNWQSYYPHGDKFECSYLHNGDGSWANNLHCGDYLNYYVCKKQATVGSLINITTEFHKFRGTCDNGWFFLGEKCYHISLSKVDYFEAMIQCQSMKGQLVSIHSSKENADLTKVFDTCETPWIGLENTDPNKISENAGWKWSDGTLVNYHNWKDGGIEKDHTKQCGMLQRGAKWENVPCWELHPFVCEKPKP